ncbi:MAG: hypothetical protein ACE5FI_04355 [Anaerolineales bacterium]
MIQSPRPESDTGIGFHYYPDDVHYREADLRAWLPELDSLRATWLTLRSTPARSVPEGFVRGLVEAGVEPIIHIRPKYVAPQALSELEPLLQAYARWGVRYVACFDRPNERAMWPAGEFERAKLVERFLDLWIPVATAAQRQGLVPVFPPLKQGGTYWDTSFLQAALAGLQRRRQTALLDELVLGCYAFAGVEAPEYGAGGPAAWPQSQPYHTPLGSQDQRGFRSFEWYAAVAASELGAPRPILMIAGGARLGDSDPQTGEIVADDWHATCNAQIAQMMLDGSLHEALLNVNYWLIAAENGDPAALAAWFRPDGTTASAVGEVKKLGRKHRAAAKGVLTSAPISPKTLRHYLLLPRYNGVASAWHWNLVGDIVQTYQPTCGFSPVEARHARFVTLIGDERGIGKDIEEQLLRAGCRVERIANADPVQAHAALEAEAARIGGSDTHTLNHSQGRQ